MATESSQENRPTSPLDQPIITLSVDGIKPPRQLDEETYGLSEAIPYSGNIPMHQDLSRRKFVKYLLGIPAAGVALSVWQIQEISKQSSNITKGLTTDRSLPTNSQFQALNNIAETDTNVLSSDKEQLIKAFIVNSYMYINPDEIALLDVPSGTEYGVEIVGSDAVQKFEDGKYNGTDLSGVDRVVKDELAFIRFAIRPNVGTQYIRSFSTYFTEPQNEYMEKIPTVFQQYPKDGRIALYLESTFEPNDKIDAFLDYVNAFSGLFPYAPPFYVIRRANSDSLIESIPPKNAHEIQPEIAITAPDILQSDNNSERLKLVQELVATLLEQIPKGDLRSLLNTCNRTLINANKYLQLAASGATPPIKWDDTHEYLTRHYLFHPSAYLPDINYEASTAANVPDILSSLLFFSQDEKVMTEFCDRLLSLPESVYVENDIFLTSSASLTNHAVYAGISFLREINPDQFATNFPRLEKIYTMLDPKIVKPVFSPSEQAPYQ